MDNPENHTYITEIQLPLSEPGESNKRILTDRSLQVIGRISLGIPDQLCFRRSSVQTYNIKLIKRTHYKLQMDLSGQQEHAGHQ